MTSTPSTSFAKIPGTPLDLMRDYDIATLGYKEAEFGVDGVARSYELDGAYGEDGHWEVAPGSEAPFRTRIVVRQPTDANRFSGVVIVEWHNVSAGLDAAPDWGFFHRSAAAAGHAWVGVSAQRAGIDGGGLAEGIHLKLLDPDRYGGLEHPGDAWSFDIFTQVGLLLRRPPDENPLEGLTAQRLLAAGESQSAAALVTYINAIDAHTEVFDGYFVHGRPAAGLGIDGVFIRSAPRGPEATTSVIASKGEQIRDDARVPVLILQSETDLIVLGSHKARQIDNDRIRLWELAGAAHADTYTVGAGRHDDGTLSAERFAELMRPTTNLMNWKTETPINAGPQQHYVAQAALAHLVNWVLEGTPPPSAPRLEVDGSGTDFRKDERGLAQGGIRTPWVDVPSAVMGGLGQAGESFAFLFGRTTPFDEATLTSLYPGGRADYLARFEAALDATIDAGFLLAEDRSEILAVAAASFPLLLA
ncbi:MAG TPA: alpha/beta hydrolase domain-containing protein [Acidimicrobiales bacterium]|nr:alpha/beta hydrolase domain-containing protein [Acidimicrobiales bacterium]